MRAFSFAFKTILYKKAIAMRAFSFAFKTILYKKHYLVILCNERHEASDYYR